MKHHCCAAYRPPLRLYIPRLDHTDGDSKNGLHEMDLLKRYRPLQYSWSSGLSTRDERKLGFTPSSFAFAAHQGTDQPMRQDPGGSMDPQEMRRMEKLLIARMLDLDEPIMTEKVRPTRQYVNAISGIPQRRLWS